MTWLRAAGDLALEGLNLLAVIVVVLLLPVATVGGAVWWTSSLIREWRAPAQPTLTSAPEVRGAAITTAGVLVVGRDVEPGTYQAYAPAGCYWAVLTEVYFDGEDDWSARAAGGQDRGAVAVTLTRHDAALVTVGCGNWVTL